MKKTFKMYKLKVSKERVKGSLYPCGKLLKSYNIGKVATKLIGKEDQEVFLAFFLNAMNVCQGYAEIARGAIEYVDVDFRVLFRAALLAPSCVKMVLVHNHPSGDCKPSTCDNRLTRAVVKLGGALGIMVVDHVIVSGDTFFSYCEHKRIKQTQ